MKNKNLKKLNKKISRRFVFLSLIKGSVIGAIGWKLFDLQLIENQKYEKLSDNNRFDFHIIPPERGKILDRKMRLIAGNEDTFHLVLNWNKTLDSDRVIARISNIVNLDKKDIINFKKKISLINEIPAKKIIITKNLSKKNLSKLAIRSIEFPEISFYMSKKRVYPQGNIVGHISGYTGLPSNNNNNFLSVKNEDIQVGKRGLEKFFDNQLRGKFGRKRNEVTSKGYVIASHIYENTISGKDVQVSLDMKLQAFASERLERGKFKKIDVTAKIQKRINDDTNLSYINKDYVYLDEKNNISNPNSGSIIVMDIENGQIICSTSSPGFDPNIFSNELEIEEWDKLKTHKRSPLLNRSMSGVYPPGSTIKMAVALAGLESGVIDYDSKFFCSGSKKIGNREFHCWLKDGHGSLNLSEAIEQSCDVYFYELGLKIGINKIALMMKKLGLGEYYDLEIDDKAKGVVPDKDWKLKRDGLSWSLGETLNASIGQGYILATPLQLVTMVSRLASGGSKVTPTLIIKKNKNDFESLNINQNHLNYIKKAMEKVVVGRKGTARNYKIGSKTIEMAGKTGTVQVVRISNEEREAGVIKNEDRIWKRRDHALFVGYAPVSKPKYAISVVVEHGGSGSSVAAPIARDVFKNIFDLS
jgi:penicillin-binding protein 2